MKKIGKILLVFLMIFSAISSQKNVYAYNEPLRFELLPLVQDTDASQYQTMRQLIQKMKQETL